MSADHREPVQRALAFIAENLHRAITLQEVAKVAGISPFYFHRIFGAVMGETVGEFITRRINQAVTGEMTVKAALDTAAKETETYLKGHGYYQ